MSQQNQDPRRNPRLDEMLTHLTRCRMHGLNDLLLVPDSEKYKYPVTDFDKALHVALLLNAAEDIGYNTDRIRDLLLADLAPEYHDVVDDAQQFTNHVNRPDGGLAANRNPLFADFLRRKGFTNA
ncbi:hypothetical protein VNI00_006472 [Paramarasmius palmivorus]|uniref:Uncharacterized protein n=1 Tax=Paramarasmius palmivorus TaxID=297713 RepID=A0AAW0D8X4_9AGAR